MTPEKKQQIFVAGHQGMVGSALVRTLSQNKNHQIIVATRQELDLTNQSAVRHFFAQQQFDQVYLAAAKVGGIHANSAYPADFIYQNLMIQSNVIDAVHQNDVPKLLFLGSSCIYPKFAEQPIKEESLLAGDLEPTNEPYAIAKIAGLKMCESFNLQYGTNFISVMPTNLYGPNDNFDLEKSHVLPAMIRKIYLSKSLMNGDWEAIQKDFSKRPVEGNDGSSSQEETTKLLAKYGIFSDRVELWGTGTPMREFLWSEDMADACVYIMEHVDFKDLAGDKKEVRNTHVNIGTGKDLTIKDLSSLIAKTLDYEGQILFDTSKPDGTMRKLVDVSKLNSLGWKHSIEIEEGIRQIAEWYLDFE